MKQEQYDNVKRFKPQFNLAKTGFVRVSRGDLDIIRRTYNDVFQKDLKPSNMNCNACVLKMMKAMGDAVEQYEKWYEARFKKEEEEPKQEETESGEVVTMKKKPGRPKKNS